MTLETFISSRLTPAGRWRSHDGRAVAEVAQTGQVDDRGAQRFEWALQLNRECLARAEDLCGFEDSFRSALHSLASFLTAWQEAAGACSGEHHENCDLFPDSCLPFLDYADEFYTDTMPEEEG